MFKPVAMLRLNLVVLAADERAVLLLLGEAGVVQLERTPAGPDTAPLPPPDHSREAARCDHLLVRLENLRRSLELPPDDGKPAPQPPGEMSLSRVEAALSALENETGEPVRRRQHLRQRTGELAGDNERLAAYRGLDLPLDQPDQFSFLHFVTGSLPAGNLEKIQLGDQMAVLPLPEQNGRQRLIALATRRSRAALEGALQAVGFEAEPFPVATGSTVDAFWENNRHEQKLAATELERLDADLLALAEQYEPLLAEIEQAVNVERRLLEADQNFPRTETAVLLTGWIPRADAPALERRLREITAGRCAVQTAGPAATEEEQVPVLLHQPRLLRPFELLVSAYGLPRYRELEPTVFVAVSYLLMFGMMFGDVGHGFVLAAGGVTALVAARNALMRNAGLLLLFGGLSSMMFGAAYGSCFGLPQFKSLALWRDPLEGDPMRLMSGAIGFGIVMIGLGLVLNILNHFRRGDFIGGCLDKFGLAGLMFYGGALMLYGCRATLQSRGLATWVVVGFLILPALGWLLKEPVKMLRHRPAHPAAAPGGRVLTTLMESLVEAFEAVLSFFANTISFVRLAAYAMSHAALLLAAFIIAGDVKHFSPGGTVLSVVVVILGNLIAIALEGIVASVQALRLEYYEFFGKFFPGDGRPFQPFRLFAGNPAEGT